MLPINEIIYSEKLRNIIYENRQFYNIYGCILYTPAHPNIIKVLRDPDYWNDFDYSATEKFPILAFKPNDSGLNSKEQLKGINDLFFDLFGISETDLPCFILFERQDDYNFICYRAKLNDDTIGKAQIYLSEIIDLISKNINKFEKTDKPIYPYSKIKHKLIKFVVIKKTVRILDVLQYIKGFF